MKRNILWLLLNSLFLIVFNMLFFMFVDNRTNPVWISYGFIHFAYVLLLLTPLFVKRGKANYIYSRPLYAVTASYFLIELVVGTAIIILAPEAILFPVIIQVILAAIFIAWLLIHLIANEHTANSVERREVELKYVKESSSQLNLILRQITDKALVKKVEKVYELIHNSPVKSHNEMQILEQEIISEINKLDRVAGQNDLEQISMIADKIYKLADQRNQQLKLLS